MVTSHDFDTSNFIWPEETSLALSSRLQFIKKQLDIVRPNRILDIGCGTGEQLTAYLAQLYPSLEILGIDEDIETIEYAKDRFKQLKNLSFSIAPPQNSLYDAVIISEVLEHVDDPCSFLSWVRTLVEKDGIIIVTTPNGYGCSEIMGGIETVLILSGVWPCFQNIYKTLFPKKKSAISPDMCFDTKAVSPHVNFFAYSKLKRIFTETGFFIIDYRGRMLLHNFLCSRLLDHSRILCKFNARLGAILPAPIVAGWMFALRIDLAKTTMTQKVYKRNLYEKIRRELNYQRWGSKVNK